MNRFWGKTRDQERTIVMLRWGHLLTSNITQIIVHSSFVSMLQLSNLLRVNCNLLHISSNLLLSVGSISENFYACLPNHKWYFRWRGFKILISNITAVVIWLFLLLNVTTFAVVIIIITIPIINLRFIVY